MSKRRELMKGEQGVVEPREEWAQQLRALRMAQGLSVRVLAELVGVSKVTIWKWEKGNCRPSPRLITSLAKALDIPPTRLEAFTSRRGAQEENPEGLEEEPLPDVIAKAKQMIADASGASPDNVTIVIEY